MKKSFLTITLAASVLALAACSDNGEGDVIVTSEVGDVTKDELYQEMKTSIGEQAVQILMIEKVLAENYEVTDEEVNAEYESNKEELGESSISFLLKTIKQKKATKKSSV